jgi:hypothetical protein
MSTLINASIRVDRLPKEKFIKGKDGAVYYNLTISVQDAKVAKTYLGNGKVVWTDGVVKLAEKEVKEQVLVGATEDDDMPF